MKAQMDTILNGIYTALRTSTNKDISLMGGRSGIVLFNFAYLKYQGPGDHTNEDDLPIQELAERSLEEMRDPGFSTGTAGLNWLFAYLYKNEILAKEDWEFLCSGDAGLETTALNLLRHGNYDFLHGAIGIGHYFLYTGTSGSGVFFTLFFDLLNELVYKSSTGTIIPGFDFTQYKCLPDEVNLGFSHGLAGILKFCLQCYKQNICTTASKILAQRIIDYLLDNMNLDRSINYFPNKIMEGRRTDEYSRLGWCYGDLGIAYTLYQSGMLFDDRRLVNLAVEILEHTTTRRMETTTQVRDAGVCHGTAGIAHLYNRIWYSTRQPVFKEACDFWMQRTIDFALYSNGLAGYEKYNARNGIYENCHELLEGAAGIGLVFLSYLTGDLSWDYCLMLND